MVTEELIAQLVRELELPGEADAEALLARWFQTGEALAGPASFPPEPVQAVEAAGPEDTALYTRVAHLQTLRLVVAGARAEYEEAQLSGDGEAQVTLVRALRILTAMTEEEGEAVRTALKAQSN